ncbi:type I restriction enzyme EcoKI subunit R [Variovorax sp. PBL-E5]|nr:type I restriction enzyme EcoKI subunit R [Variovorax sp. PBL-E5]
MLGIAEGILAGHKNQVVMSPTGSGKTYIGLRIAQKALKRGRRATFLCDRRALIEQTSAVADSYGLHEHGVIMGDHERKDYSKPLQIASVQTIASRGWHDTDVLIVDECHTQHDAWREFATNSPAHVIGLSATPFSRGLGKIFSNHINAATMHDLTQDGILVPMRVLSCRKPDMQGAKLTSDGEWSPTDAGERGMEIIGDVVSEWLRHGQRRKTIVFGSSVVHCEELCKQFNEVGVMSATFTHRTHERERPGLLREFRKPDSCIRVLISVEALAKGFDVPDVGCVVDCRPLRKSLSTAIQMWGRGLRTSADTGKTDCLLLDHSGNIVRFADDFTDVFFNGLASLDKGEALDRAVRAEPKEESERSGCPKCGYKPFCQRCMSCGHEVVRQALVVAEAGEMHEVVLNGRTLADDKVHLWRQLCTFARQTAWVKSKPGYAYMAFRDICGHPPPTGHSFEDTPKVPVSDALASRLKGKRQSFRIAERARERKEALTA